MFGIRRWSPPGGSSLALLLLIALASFAPARSAAAEDTASANWPQWRGPNLNGTTSLTGLPVQWSRTQNVRWSTPLPAWSGSSPIVWENHVFATSPDKQADPSRGRRDPGGDTIQLFALDRATGAVLWSRPLGRDNQLRMKQNMASPSPVTDGATVWAMTGQGDLVAFDFAGAELWRRNLQQDHGRFGLNWGYAASPLLLEDRLLVPVIHGMTTDEPSYLLALDKQTGKTLWKTDRPSDAIAESPDAYTTPQLLAAGGRNLVILNGGDVVTAHDAATGAELWRVGGLNPRNQPNYRIVGSCVVAGGMIFAPTRVQPLLAIRPGADGMATEKSVAWTAKGADVPTPVSDGKYLWILDDRGALSCLDAQTGKPLYAPQRLARGTYSASLVLGDGKLYATGEDGTTTVVEAGPAFKVLAENRLEDSYTLSSPALPQGQIFIRTSDRLFCIGAD